MPIHSWWTKHSRTEPSYPDSNYFDFDANKRLIRREFEGGINGYSKHLNTLSPEESDFLLTLTSLRLDPEAANKLIADFSADKAATIARLNAKYGESFDPNKIAVLPDTPLPKIEIPSFNVAEPTLTLSNANTGVDYTLGSPNTGSGADKTVNSNNTGLANVELSNWAKLTGAMGDINKAIIAPAKDLMSTYTAWKGYEQARKEYDLNRNLINQNLANQASMINRNIDASANIAAQQSGLYGNSAAIQQYNNQLRNDTLANANANKIKHNPL